MQQVEPRHFLRTLFGAAVCAADPRGAMGARLPQRPKGRTVVIGAGKGSAKMAAALEELWDGPLEGTVVTPYGYGCPTDGIRIIEAAHPVPDVSGLEASGQILEAVSNLNEDDLVIALISGGGSSLLPSPPFGFALEDEIALNEVLLASGLTISAMNTIRKHFSNIKGGRLAAATKARVVTFVASDIPGDDPALVASGPTIADNSSRVDALRLIDQYRLRLPQNIIDHIRSPGSEAPRPGEPKFADNQHHIVSSARLSLKAAAETAQTLGISAVILSDAIEGESRDVANVHAAIAAEIYSHGQPFSKPVVILSGGETTVALRQKGGRGGRNAEFALSMALAIEGHEIHVLAADTDGIDGSGTNAGAFADGTTVQRLRSKGIDGRDLLLRHNSYSAFEAIDELFVTGPTGINVNDFRAVLIR